MERFLATLIILTYALAGSCNCRVDDSSEKDKLICGDWSGAQWIGFDEMPDSMRVVPGVTGYGRESEGKVEKRSVIPMFRKDFTASDGIASATLYISGLGHYEAEINGRKVGDGFLSPGWSDYDKTVFYNTYDVTSFLLNGENTIGVIVGNGFHYNNRERYRKLIIAYGYPKMICKLAIRYNNGNENVIVSGTDWKTAPSPITWSGIYGGEDYDARLEHEGWNKSGFDDSSWKRVLAVSSPSGVLKPDMNSVKVMEQFNPLDVTQLNDSCFVCDFGQNVSGIVEIKVQGERGRQIRMYPGELVREDGSVNQRATGSPYYYTYTLNGNGEETWKPRFSYYGFRYVQIVGARPGHAIDTLHYNKGMPQILSLKSLHTRNAAARAGSFECSNELFNRIYSLVNRAIKSNLQSVVTDCPHREKLGWLEQTYLMGTGIHFNFDIHHLYKKLISDMADAQTTDGLIPSIVPEYINFDYLDSAFRDSPEWGSASIILPWMLYKWYGDKSVLEDSWPVMVSYFNYLKSRSVRNILSHGLGDWYDLGPERPGYAQLTPVPLVATATYFFDARLMSEIAGALGKQAEEQQYSKVAEEIKTDFNREFFDERDKVYSTGSQTAMAMPLSMGLVEKRFEKQVLVNLIDSIRAGNNALTAGDVGFHYLIDALTRHGASQLIYDMNNRDDVPGYGYQLKKGATTLTESWQALESVSNNHLMLGHIMEWFYQGIGGIMQDEKSTAFRDIIIKPEVVGDLTYARTTFTSPNGEIKTEWEKTDGNFVLTVVIPCNSGAKVYLPFAGEVEVSDMHRPTDASQGIEPACIEPAGIEDGRMVYRVGTGEYRFIVRSLPEAVSEEKMQEIYEEVKTPYKHGLILVPENNTFKFDCPTIFRRDGRWIMTYVVFDGTGYETHLAESKDLLAWDKKGRIMEFSDSTDWDVNQKAGYPSLIDYDWGGGYAIDTHDGKHWMSYFGGDSKGYEKGLLSIGMAFTDKEPAGVHRWQRLGSPVLMSIDDDARWYDNSTMYKNFIIEDKKRLTGYPFVMYYNARGDSINPGRGAERICMAVSDDMLNWQRFGSDPLINHHKGISGDAVFQKIGDLFVMFYFGAFWPDRQAKAFDTFACSYDLVHWTEWTGPHLIEPTEEFDGLFAHKPYVIKHDGIVWHFYNAVDKLGNRGIALATSKDIGKSNIKFNSTEESAIK